MSDPKPIQGKCPFWDQYIEDSEPCDQCIGCNQFQRYPELDRRRTRYIELAHICNKDAMTPDVYYSDLEPVMPW